MRANVPSGLIMAVLKCRKIRHPFHGKARKAAFAFLILSTLGWTIFVVFLGLTALETTVKSANCVMLKSRVDGTFTPHWCFLVNGPILYSCAVVALCVNREGYLQTIINFFVAIFFICGGAIIYTDWIVYGGALKYLFEFGACLISLVSIALYTIMVPHFKSSNPVHEQSNLHETCNLSTDQGKMISDTTVTPVPTDAAIEMTAETEDEYVVPNEMVNACNGADEEEDYVINEPFYQDCQKDEHGDEVYEDVEDVNQVIYDN